MEITWFGQAAFRLKTKNANIIIDPFDSKIGLPWTKQPADILLMSHSHFDHHNQDGVQAGFVAEGPGEYEVKEVAITGTRLYHDSSKGAERGNVTAFTINVENLTICHLSDVGHQLTTDQIEELSSPDVLLIPIGGTYTIDGDDAAKVVSQLEPRIVIPMHYQLPGLEVGAQLAGLEPFMKALGYDEWTTEPVLKVTKESLPDEMKVIVLEPRKA